MNVLHRSADYAVTDSGDGLPFVTFQSWKPDPGLDKHAPFGEVFLVRSGFRCISVTTEENCWYQKPSFDEALAVIKAALGGVRPICYGSSMGGYAAWRFADDLNAAGFISAVPQYSLNACFETRWPDERAAVRSWRQIPLRTRTRGFCMMDPRHLADRLHARLIAEVSGAELCNYIGMGHNLAEAFIDRRQLKATIFRMAQDLWKDIGVRTPMIDELLANNYSEA